MYLSTNYLISFFHVFRLCCAVYSSLVLSLPLILSLFHFHTFFSPPSNVLLHMYDCIHAIAYTLTTYMSLGFAFLYQFRQVKIRDIGEIAIVLLLREQLKYIRMHAPSLLTILFVYYYFFFRC